MRFLFIVFLLFVFFVFLFGFSILRLLFRGIFGKSNPRNKSSRQQSQTHQPQDSSASKKRIASDEGEYVDYVEIKD
ncbi:MAG: DUF4834 family protein [Dysgonamonadaceae bacterium]|nr:DUF4834 family protein [Dysgonamonadaceae bacterium]